MTRRTNTAADLTNDERNLLAYVFAKLGNRSKAAIRNAWLSGDYAALASTDRDAQTLQALRNTRGPSWLAAFRFADVATSNPTPTPRRPQPPRVYTVKVKNAQGHISHHVFTVKDNADGSRYCGADAFGCSRDFFCDGDVATIRQWLTEHAATIAAIV